MHQFDTRAIIVCGNQRSGTRMIGNILNKHDDIVVAGESLIFNKLYALIRQADYRPRSREWNDLRTQLAMNVIIETSSDKIRSRAQGCSRFGTKTPGLEFYEEKVKWMFPEACFVYCLRDPIKVMRSLKNMPWNKWTIRSKWERYKKSVAIFESMEPRPLLIQIDKVNNQEEQNRMIEDLMQFVGAKVTDRLASYGSESWEPANTINKHFEGLSDEEIEVVCQDPEYARICKEYGYRMWS